MTAARLEVEVRVDLRVEALMGAVALAAPRVPQQGWIDHPIRRKALRRWRNLRGHAAPKLVRRLLGRKFWVDDLLRIVAGLVEESGATLRARFPPAPPGSPAVAICDELAAALVDLANRGEVGTVVEESAETPAEVLAAVGGCEMVEQWVQKYRLVLGQGPARIRIFPSPLCGAHLGYGPTVGLPGDTQEAWVVFGPVWRPYRRWWEMVGFFSPKLRRVIRHELGHAHLNRHTAESGRCVAQYEWLFKPPLREAMRPYGYTRWDICLIEHVLRAMESSFVRKHGGASAGERYLQAEEEKGFTLVRAASQALEQIRLPLAAHYPEFLECLARKAAQ